MRLILRPIETWPREQTAQRLSSPFRRYETVETGSGGSHKRRGREVPYSETLTDLDRELRHLGVEEAVVQLAVEERDIRLDGELRANAVPRHPGVILTFTTRGQGVLTFCCDLFGNWRTNLRAIAKGLEALRLVDRYGITSSGEQYTGWKEIGSGVPLSARADDEPMGLEDAARMVVGWISGSHDLNRNARTAIEDADYRRYAYRQAVKHLHPDTAGELESTDGFLRLTRAMKILDENDAS